MTDIRNKHIVIAGGARSGVAVALLIQKHGGIPFVSDNGPIKHDMAKKLSAEKIQYEENIHSEKALNGDFLILSPGVPSSAPIAKNYAAKGKNIYSEIEVAGWFNRSPVVAVTGTNGKTTVANWLAHTWKTAKRDYFLAGNIGTAFSEQVLKSSPEKDALLEVSSFQLDHIQQFRPAASIILNITPDHLDRYQQKFENYVSSKLKITANQTASDWFIYNFDDPVLSKHAEQIADKKNGPDMMAFSCEKEVSNGAFIRNGHLILKINNEEEKLMKIGDIGLTGRHNLQNGMATALAARASDIKNEYIRESLQTFEGVAHRLEEVRSLDGVRYVNDSKATNINAVWYALDSFSMPVVLILGGRDKGNDYNQLADQMREKVHTVIAIGEAQAEIKKQLNQVVPHILSAKTMKEAVKLSRKQAKRGEIVLLSPACSSFDMFENYEHRGNMFKQAVLEL